MKFDFTQDTTDNKDAEPSIIPRIKGGRRLKISKKDIKPLNDPKCKHEYVYDSDETDVYRSEKCKKCPVGRLVKKQSLDRSLRPK